MFEKFLIKKGESSSDKAFSPFFRIRKITYEVIFNDTCIYKCYSGKQIFQNNLFGFKFGFFGRNSAEFSWSCSKNKILQGATYFKEGVKHVRELCELELFKFYKLEIFNFNTFYEFSVTDENDGTMVIARIKKEKKLKTNWGFLTYPNFKTFLLSLQDIEIHMQRIK